MKIIFYSIIVVIVITIHSNSQTLGKYEGEFLSLGVGSRSFAMGGATVALVNDVTAGYWNPSALTSISKTQIALMHEERFGGFLNYDYAGLALPMKNNSTIGISIIRLASDNNFDTRGALIDANTGQTIANVNNPNARIDPSRVKTFSSSDIALFFSYATQQYENLSLGANIKLIRRDNAEYSAFGVGFDLSSKYVVDNSFLLGANFQDITTTFLSWNTGRNELISPTFKLGIAYLFDVLDGKLSPASDFDIHIENRKYGSNFYLGGISLDIYYGLEYYYKNLIAIRMGYSDVGAYTYGGGIKLEKFDIDYSFSQFNTLNQIDNSQRVSIIFSFNQLEK